MVKHLFIGVVGLSSLAFADHRTPRPAAPLPAVVQPTPPPPMLTRHQRDDRRDDRLDVRVGRALLRDFEQASSRRDERGLRSIDDRFASFIGQELTEARREDRGPEARRTVEALMGLQRRLSRVHGRVDSRALNVKRQLFTNAVDIAERDLRDDRRSDDSDRRRR